MRKFHPKQFALATLLLTFAILFANCESQKMMPGGLDFNSLDVKNPEIVKTFEAAKEKNKNVLLVFDAVWCGYCRLFNQKTMKDAEVQKTLAGFEVLNIDIDKFPDAARAFKSGSAEHGGEGIPAILIFSAEGFQTDEVLGYYEAEEFNEILKRNL